MSREYKCVLKEKYIDVRGFIEALALHIKNEGIKRQKK